MAANAPTGQIVIGAPHSKGYRVMGFENKILFVHRVKFAVKHGWMPRQIDHVNRKRDDNRLRNLRPSTPQKNQQNRTLSKLNKSGYRGVHAYGGKWIAQLRIKWRRHNLGRFDKKEDAIKAVSDFLSLKS